MEKIASEAKFKISDIKGPYQLLGAFLIVFETLLGIWMFRAETPTERIVAGLLMIVLLAGFLFVVLRMQKPTISTPDPRSLRGKVTAGTEFASSKDLDTPSSQQIASPDRCYLINKPPPSWDTKETTMAEWLVGNLKLDKTVGETLSKSISQKKDILVFTSSNETVVTPIPGKTIIDGRLLPSALYFSISTRLSILPFEHYNPPFYYERSLLHNFCQYVGQILNLGLVTIRDIYKGILPNTQIQYISAEFRQEIRNASVNGKTESDIDSNIICIGIEGEIRDHLLVLNYPSLPTSSESSIDQNLKELRALASSFRPIAVADPIEKKKEIREEADNKFAEHIKDNAKNAFENELGMLLMRFSESDMEIPEKRAEAINTLKPFRIWAEQLEYKDEDLDKLWDALQEAEKGDAKEFISSFIKLRQAVMKGFQQGLQQSTTQSNGEEHLEELET